MVVSPERNVDLMALDEALDRLAKFAARKAEGIELEDLGNPG
jgi:hypothetical protein